MFLAWQDKSAPRHSCRPFLWKVTTAGPTDYDHPELGGPLLSRPSSWGSAMPAPGPSAGGTTSDLSLRIRISSQLHLSILETKVAAVPPDWLGPIMSYYGIGDAEIADQGPYATDMPRWRRRYWQRLLLESARPQCLRHVCNWFDWASEALEGSREIQCFVILIKKRFSVKNARTI